MTSFLRELYCGLPFHLFKEFHARNCESIDDNNNDNDPPPPREREVNENSRSEPSSPRSTSSSPAPSSPPRSESASPNGPPRRSNDSPRDAPPPPTPVTPNRRDLSSSPKAADAPAAVSTQANDTNSSASSPLANNPAPIQGGNPFPDTPTTAAGAHEGQRLPGAGGNPTILIVSMVCAAMFAMLLVGAFVYHRRKQSRARDASRSVNSAAAAAAANTNELEDGIFDAVPKPKPGTTEFTIEDFTAAPIGLYDRDTKSPPPPSMPVFELNMDSADGEKGIHPLSAIPKHMLINTTAPFSPTLPESGRSTPLTGRDVIFSSPFSPTDTGYHIAEDQVFGAPMYSNGPKVPPTQPTYSPNTAAIAAAVVSAVQGTASTQHSPTFLKSDSRISMEWPSAFDDEAFGADARSGIVDMGYGANMAGDDDIEEFPDVPRVDPADPRLKVM